MDIGKLTSNVSFRRILDGLILIWIILFLVDRFTPWLSNFDASVLVSKYTESEINHFANFALSEGKLKKWKKDIKLKVIESSFMYSHTDSLTRQCVNLLNSFLDDIDINIVTEHQNVSVLSLDSIMHNRWGIGKTNESVFYIPFPLIKSGEIEIYIDNQHVDKINSIIHHEFGHILGFHHNLLVDYQSVFNPGPRKFLETDEGDRMVPSFDNYSELDKAAIRIMYDKDVGIDPGLTKRKFFRMIKKAKKEMGYEDPVVGGG